MDRRIKSTIEWYAEQADSYVARTLKIEMRDLYRPFLEQLRPHSHILDVGCGSGRDSLAFLRAGYRVTALDASPEMAKRAEQTIGQEVRVQHVETLADQSSYHAIWACASLLHLRPEVIPAVLGRLQAALVPGGLVYLSFKYGRGERTDQGRHFTDADEYRLHQWLQSRPELIVQRTWVTGDRLSGRQNQIWLNGLLKNLGNLVC